MTKEGLELFPGDRDGAFSLMLPLVLLPTEVDAVPKERYYKKNAVGTFSPGDGKVIFTPLAELIAFHAGLTTIDVR